MHEAAWSSLPPSLRLTPSPSPSQGAGGVDHSLTNQATSNYTNNTRFPAWWKQNTDLQLATG